MLVSLLTDISAKPKKKQLKISILQLLKNIDGIQIKESDIKKAVDIMESHILEKRKALGI
jgi:hydroxylamine reductase (hybrid-cluster protein)